MNNSTPTPAPTKPPAKKRRYLSADKKFQIYLEAQSEQQPVGEILRREGLFSTDLARIRQAGQGRGLATPQRQARAQARGGQRPILREPQARTPGEGSDPGRSGRRTGHPAKKNDWDFVGPIADRWLDERTKRDILTLIETSQQHGVSARRSCALLIIEHRRACAGSNGFATA